MDKPVQIERHRPIFPSGDQGLVGTGLNFCDDEVTAFFSPHTAGKSAIFHVALGHLSKGALIPFAASPPDTRGKVVTLAQEDGLKRLLI